MTHIVGRAIYLYGALGDVFAVGKHVENNRVREHAQRDFDTNGRMTAETLCGKL